MIVDLMSQAGFALLLDTSTFEVATPSEVRFIQEPRRIREMKTVLFEPEALPDESVLYWNYKLDQAGEAGPLLEQFSLTFGLVLLPPLRVGREFVKTHGHYHPTMPGSVIGFPEVYSHYFGDLHLFMQRRECGSTARLDDCVLYKMKPGHSIMIPPGYAHILINLSKGPALMGGLYARDAVHDYEPLREMGGGAYYFIAGNGPGGIIPNPRYENYPPLRWIEDLSGTRYPGTRFVPPDDGRPLWSSFVSDPQRYAFITDPELAKSLFTPEDQRQ